MNIDTFPARRLRTRFVFWTAVIVTLAVWGSFEFRTRTTLSMLERDAEERSATLLRTAIRTLDVAGESIDPVAIGARIQDLVDSDSALFRVDLVRFGPGGAELVRSSTDTVGAPIDGLARTAESRIERQGSVRELITTEPVSGTDYWLVGVTSLRALDRYAVVNRRWAAVFSIVVVVVVVLLMGFVYDRLVARRFDRLIRALGAAEGGRLAETLATEPKDEIHLLGRAFEQLLSQLQGMNETLQSRVDEATTTLKQRNRRLEETVQELIAAEKQVLQSERLATVGQMAAMFAHEIGSPLSALSAHVQLLSEEPDLSEEQGEALSVIRDQISSLVEIVNEMLRAARHGPENFVHVDLSEVLEKVRRLVAPKLRSRKVEVVTAFDKAPAIQGYPLYLQEVFLNLINNASDAMPRGGQLRLELWHDPLENRVNVRITDTGEGIDPRIADRLFEGFATTKDLGNGTGLGLAIVRDIVKNHRGALELSSENGKGTTALVWFPASAS